MRRSVSLLVLAVTTMVAIAFVLPLGMLVRRQANDRAVAEAQRNARAVASALAVAEALSGGSAADVASTVLALSAEGSQTTLFLPDGTLIGFEAEVDASVTAALTGVALTANDDGGVEVLIPVAGAGGTTVVRTFVPTESLTEGVMAAWIALGALGVLLVAGAVFLADRLGRSTVAPVHELAAAARRMGSGDLDARVVPGGPSEVEAMGVAFNELADRLDDLLAAERESVADLSHRLRTPLTALRLGVERLDEPEIRDRLLADVDRLGRQVDAVITEARRRPEHRHRTTDLADIVRERFSFWKVLAEEQQRAAELSVTGGPFVVALPDELAADVIEALLENVFSHTAPPTPFSVTLAGSATAVVLTVSDGGSGLPAGFRPSRGDSTGDSTGLGLDIVARTAARVGGTVSFDRSPLGGAAIEVSLRPA